MPNQMHILVNDFAIRSFRETADKDTSRQEWLTERG